MLLQWSTNFGSVPTCTTDDGDAFKNCNTSGMPSPTSLLLPRVSGTCKHTSSWIPAYLTTVRLSIKARLLHQEGTTRIWHRPFLYIKLKPSLRLVSGTQHRGWRLGQSKLGLLWTCASSKLMQASLGGTETLYCEYREMGIPRLHNSTWKQN